MGICRMFTYSSNGTEIEFMQGLIDLICLDTGITCEDESGNPTTAAEQFADLTSASTAKFYFNLGNGTRFQMVRNANNSSNCKSYLVDGTNIEYADYSAPSATTYRAFNIFYYKSDNVVMFGMCDRRYTLPQNINRSFMIIKNEQEKFATRFSGTNYMGQTFSSNTATVTFSNIFSYQAGAGKIDYIDKSIFVSSGIKLFDCPDIKNCSNVSQWASISLPDGKNYLAVSANAMVELDAEET